MRISVEGRQSYNELTSLVYDFYKCEYKALTRELETAVYYVPLVKDRYRYKGVDCYRNVCKNLKHNDNYTKWIDTEDVHPVVIVKNSGYGEFALLYALVHRSTQVFVFEQDENIASMLTYCAKDIVDNLEVIDNMDTVSYTHLTLPTKRIV